MEETMIYLDEDILKEREEEKKKKYTTLEDGIYMDGKIIKFEREQLLEVFSIFLPKSMKQMAKEYARIKYPSEFRPQVIITTLNLSVNIGFSVFPNEIQSDDTIKVAERMRAAIHRSNPDYPMYSCEVLKEIEGCWFAFRSHAMDSDLYNMMLIMSINKRIVQGSFNCPYKTYQEWKKIVLMMWESIQELEEKK